MKKDIATIRGIKKRRSVNPLLLYLLIYRGLRILKKHIREMNIFCKKWVGNLSKGVKEDWG